MKQHTAGEDYLEAILILQEQLGSVRSIDVARYLNFSRPSVSNAVTVLKGAGLLDMREDFSLYLTEQGMEIAQRTYERHCFFTELLMFAGVEREAAEHDACRIEHDISEDAFRKLKAKLKPYLDAKQ